MKRDPDMVRNILLALEQDGDWVSGPGAIAGLGDWNTVQGHLKILADAGWVEAHRGPSGHVSGWRLTWQGHEFLDTTRDPAIWSQTKTGAEKLGAWSLKLLGEIATGFVKAKAQSLGLPIS